MNTATIITATVVLVSLFVICIVMLIYVINTIKESNKLRAKIKQRRYLELKDYTDAILLVILFLIGVVASGTIVYLLGKIWNIF